MQLRIAKGQCHNCDEKYSLLHKCPKKRLLLLQWDEEQLDTHVTKFLQDPNPLEQVESNFTAYH